MGISKESEKKINELQLLEQNLQNFLLQRQNFQIQISEIENALTELDNSDGNVYKITGGLMIKSDKERLKIDLTSKKEIIELRIKNIEKQELKIKGKINELQGEVMKGINKDGK